MDQVELYLENAACFDKVCCDLMVCHADKVDIGFESFLLLYLNWIKSIPATEVCCRDMFFHQNFECAHALSATYFLLLE
jgi:hypothetical protein